MQEQGYDILSLQQVFILKLVCPASSQTCDCDHIMEVLLSGFQAQGIPVLLSRFGNNCIGCFSSPLKKDPHIMEVHKNISEYAEKITPAGCSAWGSAPYPIVWNPFITVMRKLLSVYSLWNF